MRQAIQQWIVRNFYKLYKLDITVARLLGVPAPHTLSSYAWKMEQDKKFWGKFWRPIIDKIFFWLFGDLQRDHCKADYQRVMAGRAAVPIKL